MNTRPIRSVTWSPCHLVTLSLVACLTTACTSSSLRYHAEPQPPGANIYADYTALQDSVVVTVDTGGGRLEQAFIQKPDGSIVQPTHITLPTVSRPMPTPPPMISGAGPAAVSSGNITPPSPPQQTPLTTLTFDQAAIGPPPWQLHIKVQNVPAAIIPNLGTPTTK